MHEPAVGADDDDVCARCCEVVRSCRVVVVVVDECWRSEAPPTNAHAYAWRSFVGRWFEDKCPTPTARLYSGLQQKDGKPSNKIHTTCKMMNIILFYSLW